MTSERDCPTCRHNGEDFIAKGTRCNGCLSPPEGGDHLPGWEPAEQPERQAVVDCKGLMCHERNCRSCYPLRGQSATVVIIDEVEPTLPMDLPEHLPENPKAIHGRAKPSLSLIPSGAMIEEAGVLALGAEKYGPFNWRKDPVESMTYVNAAMRHLLSWVDGEDLDPESQRSHLAHARACLGILLDAQSVDKLIDDRPHTGAASRMIAERTTPVNL